jgi:hypothetical protein
MLGVVPPGVESFATFVFAGFAGFTASSRLRIHASAVSVAMIILAPTRISFGPVPSA